MTDQEEKYFEIRAKSIAVIPKDDDTNILVIFFPEQETLERLEALKKGDHLGQLKLIDKWDDGDNDIRTSNNTLDCESSVASPLDNANSHYLKTHTWKLETKVHRRGILG